MAKRIPGSIRDEGFATLGVSLVTRNMLKQLAGDMPLSNYLKELAKRELGNKPSLPGQEYLASENTIMVYLMSVQSQPTNEHRKICQTSAELYLD